MKVLVDLICMRPYKFFSHMYLITLYHVDIREYTLGTNIAKSHHSMI